MIIPDVKKAMTIMMAKRSPKGESLSGPTPMKNEVVKTEEGDLDGRHSAAQDILHAVNSKSAERLMDALANFSDMHSLRKAPSED